MLWEDWTHLYWQTSAPYYPELILNMGWKVMISVRKCNWNWREYCENTKYNSTSWLGRKYYQIGNVLVILFHPASGLYHVNFLAVLTSCILCKQYHWELLFGINWNWRWHLSTSNGTVGSPPRFGRTRCAVKVLHGVSWKAGVVTPHSNTTPK